MIRLFIQKNKRAIKNGFFWISLIFTLIILIVFLIASANNQAPDLLLSIVVLLSAGIGFPIFGIFIGFLKWWSDYSVINKCFNSFPFNQLDSIGFESKTKNENSKHEFTIEYFTGKIGDYIVDCFVDTQDASKNLSFIYYTKNRQLDKFEYNKIQDSLKMKNGFIDTNWIVKKYSCKNHSLKSVEELKNELSEFAELIKKENFEPDYIARR